MNLQELCVDANHEWCNRTIEELHLPDETLVVLIKRGKENIIPMGKTRIREQDVLVMYQ